MPGSDGEGSDGSGSREVDEVEKRPGVGREASLGSPGGAGHYLQGLMAEGVRHYGSTARGARTRVTVGHGRVEADVHLLMFRARPAPQRKQYFA